MNLKRIIIFLIFILLVISCSNKEINKNNELNKNITLDIPNWYGVSSSSDNEIYFFGTGESSKFHISSEKAKAIAYSGASEYLNGKIKTELEIFIKEKGFNSNLKETFEQIIKKMSEAKVYGGIIKKQKTIYLKNGNLQTFICLSISKENISKSVAHQIEREKQKSISNKNKQKLLNNALNIFKDFIRGYYFHKR